MLTMLNRITEVRFITRAGIMRELKRDTGRELLVWQKSLTMKREQSLEGRL